MELYFYRLDLITGAMRKRYISTLIMFIANFVTKYAGGTESEEDCFSEDLNATSKGKELSHNT